MELHKLTFRTFNNIAIALVISAQYLSYVAKLYFGISAGLVTKIIFLSILIELFIFLAKRRHTIEKGYFVAAIYILMFFAISIVFFSRQAAQGYFVEFVIYAGFAILALTNEFDEYNILTFIMLNSILFLISPSRFMHGGLLDVGYERLSMFSSYTLVPCLAAFIIHALLSPSRKTVHYVLYVTCAIESIYVLPTIGRGPLLVLITVLLVSLNQKMINKGQRWSSKRRIIIFLVVIAVFACVMYYDSIIYIIDDLLIQSGHTVAAIHKIRILVNQNNLLNFRENNWKYAMELITKYPIIGGGIGVYADVYGAWPHNIFLQMFDEMGLIGALPLVVVVLFGIYKNVFLKYPEQVRENQKGLCLYILTFSLSIVRLMLSTYYWHLPEFWIFFFMTVHQMHMRRKE